MTEYEKYLEAQRLAKLMSQPAQKMEVTPERMEELREKYKTELQALETPERKEKDFLAAYGSYDEYEKSHKPSHHTNLTKRLIQSFIDKPIPAPAADTEKTKHSYPILSEKYDATKVYNSFFKREICLCTIECFNDWFVNGYKADKITPTLKGRQNKIAIAKIRCFIEMITENYTDLKDGYYNAVFGLKLNNTKTAKNLSLEHEEKLKLCKK